MATFERKVSVIFYEQFKLVRRIPTLIRQLFQESESEFKRRLKNASKDEEPSSAFLKLYDILFIDFYFEEIDDWFLNWVCEHHAEDFTENELKEMRIQAKSHLDFYEILEVFPGEGSRIKSLYSGHEYELKDVFSSHALTKWDIVLMRQYPMGKISRVTGSLSLFRALDRDYIIKEIEKEHHQYIELFHEEDYAAFAKNRWDVFIRIERELHEQYKNKQYFTEYGKLQFCEVRFKVNDFGAVLLKMKDLDEFHFLEKKLKKDKKRKYQRVRYDFDWLTLSIEKELSKIKSDSFEDGILLTTHQLDIEGKQTGINIIGTFYVDQYLARIETRSVELAEFARTHFLSVFGEALTFKRIIIKNMEKLFNKREVHSESEPNDTIDPMIQDTVFKDLYMGLLDQKVPALNNMTPREACKNPDMVPSLINWLKAIENIEERKRKQGEKYFSIDQLKKELNLDF